MENEPPKQPLWYMIWLGTAAVAAIYMLVDTFLHGVPTKTGYIIMVYVLATVLLNKYYLKKKKSK